MDNGSKKEDRIFSISTISNKRNFHQIKNPGLAKCYLRVGEDSRSLASIYEGSTVNHNAIFTVNRGAGTGGSRPNLDRSFNPISTCGGSLCPPLPYYYSKPARFSDLPTALTEQFLFDLAQLQASAVI